MRFKDKVVLITGSARNTGLAIAEAFAGEGAVVVLNDREAEDVAREAKRLRRTFGATVIEAAADIAGQEAVDALFATIRETCGRLDVLVNNAVIAGYIRTERWDVLADGVENRRLANIPLRAEALGSDIADAVLFLASDAAARINGERLVVDGGSLAQLYPSDCDT